MNLLHWLRNIAGNYFNQNFKRIGATYVMIATATNMYDHFFAAINFDNMPFRATESVDI